METKTSFTDLIEHRLYYLLNQCDAQEYDIQEVNALIDTLRTLRKEDLAVSSAHISLHSASESPHIHKIHVPPASFPKKNVAAMSIAAAACIISAVLIGINSPINAGPDFGFFYWLNQDDKGITMITDPESNNTTACVDCQCCEKCPCGCTSKTVENE